MSLQEMAKKFRKEGATFKKIAAILGVSETTARRYCKAPHNCTTSTASVETAISLVKINSKIIRNCRMSKASEKEMAAYKQFMTIELLDGTLYHFDCFYERAFFPYWSRGEKPSYAVFLHCLQDLVQQGCIEESDTNYIFTTEQGPDRAEFFLRKLTREGEWYYPTTEKMDKSYLVFQKFLCKGLVSAEDTPDNGVSYGKHTHSTENIRSLGYYVNDSSASEEKAWYAIKKLGIIGLLSEDKTRCGSNGWNGIERFGDIYNDFIFVVKDVMTGDNHHEYVRFDFNNIIGNNYHFIETMYKAATRKMSKVIQRNVALSMTPEEYTSHKGRLESYCGTLLTYFIEWVTNKGGNYSERVDSWNKLVYSIGKFGVEVKLWSAYSQEVKWREERYEKLSQKSSTFVRDPYLQSLYFSSLYDPGPSARYGLPFDVGEW